LRGRRLAEFDVALHLRQVFARVILERRGEQRLFAVEVVVDEAVRHIQALGHIGHARARKTALNHHFARRLENLHAARLDGVLFHHLCRLVARFVTR